MRQNNPKLTTNSDLSRTTAANSRIATMQAITALFNIISVLAVLNSGVATASSANLELVVSSKLRGRAAQGFDILGSVEKLNLFGTGDKAKEAMDKIVQAVGNAVQQQCNRDTHNYNDWQACAKQLTPQYFNQIVEPYEKQLKIMIPVAVGVAAVGAIIACPFDAPAAIEGAAAGTEVLEGTIAAGDVGADVLAGDAGADLSADVGADVLDTGSDVVDTGSDGADTGSDVADTGSDGADVDSDGADADSDG